MKHKIINATRPGLPMTIPTVLVSLSKLTAKFLYRHRWLTLLAGNIVFVVVIIVNNVKFIRNLDSDMCKETNIQFPVFFNEENEPVHNENVPLANGGRVELDELEDEDLSK